MYCQKSGNPDDTLNGVIAALMYYGLLRCVDVLKIEKKDVSHDPDGRIQVKFEHTRKRLNPGFTYYIPKNYSVLFKLYESELNQKCGEATRYLKLYNRSTMIRYQNSGKTQLQ